LWAASGTFGWGFEAFEGGFFSDSLGAVVTKGVSPEPMNGAPHPRIAESGRGVAVVNAIGLQNPGLDLFLKNYWPRYGSPFPCPVWVNVLGGSIDGYKKVVSMIQERAQPLEALAGFELNVSCPNVDKGGAEFGEDPKVLAELVRVTVQAAGSIPVMVKLGPLSSRPEELAKIAEANGASAISISNTIPAGFPEPEKPGRWSLGRRSGGLSGPPLRLVSLRLVDRVASQVAIPICGIGGVYSTHDAREYFAAGARVIQIGTAHFINPWVASEIANGLSNF
jgi:dihydroorotate dehydrogenase (NAD+) catalytic subunit